MNLIDSLIKDGWLKTPRIIDAFRKIKREDFMTDDIKHLAEVNQAISIGFEQTISQPLTVAFMLEKLQPQKGDKILDVGSGSGWTSALLAHCVGKNGKVIAMEIIPELKKFGEKNATKYDFIEKGILEFICADATRGYKKEAPYDKILVSASAKKLPKALKNQLKIKGRIVAPIKSSIWLFIKKSENNFEEHEYPGFVFVPLVSKV
jgi:protein-L-isoaspartate(D-aspartate) O-methyltransferase